MSEDRMGGGPTQQAQLAEAVAVALPRDAGCPRR